jgi:hypothetical protein
MGKKDYADRIHLGQTVIVRALVRVPAPAEGEYVVSDLTDMPILDVHPSRMLSSKVEFVPDEADPDLMHISALFTILPQDYLDEMAAREAKARADYFEQAGEGEL